MKKFLTSERLATAENRLSYYHILLERTLNLKDADGCAPLHLTADVGKLDAVRLLLAFGADIDAGTKIKEPHYITVHTLDTQKLCCFCSSKVQIRHCGA